MTPAEFQDHFGTNQKGLRRYLRDRWPHAHNERWVLDEAMIVDALQHFGIPASSYGPATPQVNNQPPAPRTVESPGGELPRPASPPLMNTSQIIDTLTMNSGAQSPSVFPVDKLVAQRAGMYVWWADDVARQVLGAPLDVALPPLIYIGQAGATRWPSGTPSDATLGSRISKQHIRGNARSSTFRLTISALLLDHLHLAVEAGGRLQPASNREVSLWIAEHLRVAIAPFDDRDRLAAVEADVVSTLDPPLNLEHCYPTAARRRLSALRKRIARL